MPRVSIIIPTFNGLAHLQRCLPAIRRYALPDTEVLIIDDASTDDTVLWVRQHFPEMNYFRSETNQGFCAGVNHGLARARGDIIEILNNDTEVYPGWMQSVLPHFADPNVGSVAPLVLRMDDPTIIDGAGIAYHICGWATDRGYGQTLNEEYLKTCEVFGSSASGGFYRRSALEKTGGMLPEYEAYLEDVDLAFRLRWAGYRCIYEPKSRLLHKRSASYSPVSDRVIRLLSRNEEFLFWMNLSRASLVRGLLPHLGFVAVRTLRKILSGRLLPYLAGKYQALGSWQTILRQRQHITKVASDRKAPDTLWTANDRNVFVAGLEFLRNRQCA